MNLSNGPDRAVSNTSGVVIIGGGHAGGAAALALRRLGYAGPVTIIGAEPTSPYERPAVSKAYLADPSTKPTTVCADWAEHDVEMRLNTAAISIDRAQRIVETSDGTNNRARLSYKNLILAMGGRLRRLRPEAAGARVHYLRTIEDADSLRSAIAPGRRLIVIGAGVIGLEAAATARSMGACVEVLEAAARPMARNAPADLAADIVNLHAGHDVSIACGVTIASVHKTADGVAVDIAGSETSPARSITGDAAIAGLGVVPDTTLAEAAGLAVENGVLVNERQQTGDPAIYAVGDLAAVRDEPGARPLRLETWANAEESAARAAAAIVGAPQPPRRAPWFWTDQYDVNIQIAGDVTNVDYAVSRQSGSGKTRLYYKGDLLVGATTWNAGRDMSVLRRMLDGGLSPSPAEAAETDLSLRELLKRAQSRNA